ncbi:MAG: DUF4304 domain-containing protein [Bacteroidota bacterium]|uniref:DUF4304 domain-containing protein n=1 Tax=Flagellimonas profundi TaxID=2915620 RepID=A0ABS3FFN0_9FLAO|nr:DUF4304 domain-containing protein [Allomuricauda profundi]MBO0341974.1 DUF4304 domain-containing protein [Allomuricauda profundi]MEC7769863.1 DUF4304 domain-containing protein [Bacteroidota bacterium]
MKKLKPKSSQLRLYGIVVGNVEKMTNAEFKSEINRLLKPLGFKKKGNKWISQTEELEKIIELQKSNYSNSYYLNYGFNFKDLDYKKVTMHIWNRLDSFKRKENDLLIRTLDLENSLESIERYQNLEHFINNLLLPKINGINQKEDVIKELKTRKHLNDIFLPVKRHLNLNTE